MPTYNQLNTLWFTESTQPDITHYELDVMQGGAQVGVTQIISLDDAADGYDETSGEIELYLTSIIALPSDASGEYSFYIYAVDALGRSELPLNIFNLELSFITGRLLPMPQNKRGILLKNTTEPFFSSIFSEGNR